MGVLPLPQWRAEGDYWVTDDDQMNFMRFHLITFYGFDLPAYDIWLQALVDSGAETELPQRRTYAILALQAGQAETVVRHLEWMLQRQKAIQRSDYLLPLARRGRQANEDLAKARETAVKYSGEQNARWRARMQDPSLAHLSLRSRATLIARESGIPEAMETIRKLK
jgi:hypothetical protein